MIANMPVLIRHNGETKLYVFTDFATGGECTAQTRSGRRCRNAVWEHGQEAGYTIAYAGDLVVQSYGPLPDEDGHRYLEQRCRVHNNLKAEAFCDPEWELFDPHRHQSMGVAPCYGSLFGADRQVPPVHIVVLALREHCTPAERRILADMLAAEDPLPAT
ncbi:hypothetical protein [Amycolatopsis sp. cmx-4-61]|uniref:hypothetical protein n=1 Tax=Amycolatopsis sp. cmx-4-61 TaxID=2790937 RepID=UPI00397A0502